MNSIRIINNDIVPDVRDVVFDKPLDDEAYEFLDSTIEEAQQHKKNGSLPPPIILNETKLKLESYLKKRGYQVQDNYCVMDVFI